MQVIIAGGGTGGHVFPALAVGAELIRRGAGVTFVGTKKGLESELVPKRGWKIEYLSAPRWKGESKLNRMRAIIQIPIAVVKALKIISKHCPDMVIGVGGYVSAPMLAAAIIRHIPTLIMEQNSIPGLTNRVLSRLVRRICVSFPASEHYFNSRKVVLTGNPVREEIREVPKVLPPFKDRFTVMCFGGSQGAKSINEAMFAGLRFLRPQRRNIKIIHQIGFNMDIEIARDIYRREDFDAEVFRFIDDIADCYGRAHLVICRAGATSIAELTVAARPSVLVPYPYAANNHQEENARHVADGGGAVTILNRDLTGERLSEVIIEFMSRPQKLKEMGDAMRKMSKPHATEMIVEECFKLCA